MNVPNEPGTWTPEQATEAMLHIAVEQQAPAWAEQLFLLLLTAREVAPEGAHEAWMDHARTSFLSEVGSVGDRIVAHAGATPEQTTRFAHEVSAAIQVRFAELKAGALQQGGRA